MSSIDMTDTLRNTLAVDSSDDSNEIEINKSKRGFDETEMSQGGLRQRKNCTLRTVKRTYTYSSSFYDEENRKKLLNGEDRPDLPCHQACDSPFSTSSGFHNFRGLLNWCILMLVLTTGRTALEDFMKCGIHTGPINGYRIVAHSPTNFPLPWIVLGLGLLMTITFLVEKMAASTNYPEPVITVLHSLNLLIEISLPAVLVYHFHPHPFLSSTLLGFCIILFLKLTSYVQVNKWCRQHLRKQQTNGKFKGLSSKTIEKLQQCMGARCVSGGNKSSTQSNSGESNESAKNGCNCGPPSQRSMSLRNDKFLRTLNSVDDHGLDVPKKWDDSIDPKRYMVYIEHQQYPCNLNIKDFCYFLLAPTVCYELNFPRTTRIRKRFLMSRAVESLCLWGLTLSLIQQWIYPTLVNSIEMFQQMTYPMMVVRILKLAIPIHLICLMVFYWFFHSCCNIIAELMRFGDRMFYKDWWNAESMQQFWSMWNIPIHRFAIRHVYKPLLSRGISKTTANMVVFLISALFHDYLCSIPLKMFRPWFFVSFALQMPLVAMSSRLTGKLGNTLMWMITIFVQPTPLLIYFHDYYITHRV